MTYGEFSGKEHRRIISVHTPKVAGTSFLRHLQAQFGETAVRLDYSEDPANILSIGHMDPGSYIATPLLDIAPHRVVHGHFRPEKYAAIQNAVRITFLRHPVDNVISIFNFWRFHGDDAWPSPIYQYFRLNGLCIQRLAALPIIRHLYTETYFSGCDMRSFDFIGDYDCYSAELRRLGGLLNVRFSDEIIANQTKYAEGRHVSDDVRKSLTSILKRDIEFYEAFKGR